MASHSVYILSIYMVVILLDRNSLNFSPIMQVFNYNGGLYTYALTASIVVP